jgi:hypothetical protein
MLAGRAALRTICESPTGAQVSWRRVFVMSEPRKRARRCPMCGIVKRPSAPSRACGHHLERELDALPIAKVVSR